MKTAVPTVASMTACEELDGAVVEVLAVYKTMMLPRSARPGSPLLPSERVSLELSDGRSLALETHSKGARSSEEKSRFLNQRVRVRGTLVRHAQLWGTPEQASIVMNAIINIEAIELA